METHEIGTNDNFNIDEALEKLEDNHFGTKIELYP